MKDFATALALVLVIEGAVYALFPNQMKRGLGTLQMQSTGMLQAMGLVATILGVAGVWVLRG